MHETSAARQRTFDALADPSRRAIFEALAGHEAAVKDLTAQFALTQPAVSQHLARLREAGLVRSRKEGRCVVYAIEPQGLAPLIDWLEHHRRFWPERLDRLDQLLQEMEP